MEIIPAIDLMDGKVVRLLRGDPATKKTYEHLGEPVTVAERWLSEGARFLHIVDLDATLGLGNNSKVIRKIVNTVEAPVQVGGGIRSLDIARGYFNIGVSRVILGSLAFEDPSQVKLLLDESGSGCVVIAVDHIHGEVMTRGWKTSAGLSVDEAVSRFLSLGAKFFLVTSISRDGTLTSLDFETLNRISNFRDARIIASGGTSSLEDLVNLKRIGIYGVVIGKALYEEKIRLKDAVKIAQ